MRGFFIPVNYFVYFVSNKHFINSPSAPSPTPHRTAFYCRALQREPNYSKPPNLLASVFQKIFNG
jgi:hypothetical protein